MIVRECGGEADVGSADHARGREAQWIRTAKTRIIERAGIRPGDAPNHTGLGKRAVIRFKLIPLLAPIHGTWGAVERVR
jgi:hypothetical protein